VRAALLLAVALTAAPEAQSTQSRSSQPKALYTEALSREALLRKDLDAAATGPSQEAVLKRVRALVGAYDDMTRLFPTSGYTDNALWQGGLLAADAYWKFKDAVDRATAMRMLDMLAMQFEGGSLANQAGPHLQRLTGASSPPAPVRALAPPKPPAAAVSAQPASLSPALLSPVALTAIKRESLPGTLRVTLELDREVPFHDERLDGPPRVFLDLQNTRAVPALRDAIIPFGDDLVQRVRVGRQLDSRTRVVLDLTANARYSVYTLYNPYRIVIDLDRTPAPAPVAPTAEARLAPAIQAKIAPKSEAKIAPTTDVAIAPTPPSTNKSGSFSLSRQLGLGAARIVIDPGHGGHDPGAKARGLAEAELVLDIAQRLEKLLAKQPGVEVVLTRRTDAFVSLEERTDIANREGADLFLSIHANASADAGARGIETYFLNFAANPEAEAVAARENAGAAKNMRHLPEIVKAIALNNKIDESRDFAGAVQVSLHERLRKANKDVKNLGVKQAPFMVLIGATMPSVLAEISFITNRQESALLKTEKYRDQIAEALLAGVMTYQQSLKRQPVVSLSKAGAEAP
jgi:N-acetylmuramoyl-L-alanine amidase